MDEYHNKMKIAELALNENMPVYEMEYMLESDPNRLKLYDCFIPRLKQHLISKPAYKRKHYEEQEKLREEQRSMNNQLRKENKKLKEENTDLKHQVTQLTEDFDIVNWYIEVLEAGKDTKKMMECYKKSKNKIKELAEEILNQDKEAKKKLA